MNLRFCILGSGSSGNCTYVSSGDTSILVDAGFSGKETVNRLGMIGVEPGDINAVCLTHEHSDHTSGLRVLCGRYGIMPYANRATIEALAASDPRYAGLRWNIFSTGNGFKLGSLFVEPFSVPHDAYDPVGFVISGNNKRIGIVTDMGVPTHLIREKLKNCDALIVESNHDERMLEVASRPWQLKQRIAGRQGHLSNAKAAEMITEIAGPDLIHVFLSHLSADCNRPELALKGMCSSLVAGGHNHISVHLSYPDRISDLCRL